jgi:putative FmdB family regulatory protein
MPIYGYDCNACGREFQMLVRAADVPACPACESPDLARRLSLIAAPARSSSEAPACDGAGACGMCSPGMCD